MPQNITTSFQQLIDAANEIVEEITIEEALDLHKKDDVQFIDIRDIRELDREGRVPGAYHCPRGMLEAWIDPESPYAKTAFQQDKTYVFFCAGGLRSALGARSAHEMGLAPIKHIGGGFGAWRKAGGAIEIKDRK